MIRIHLQIYSFLTIPFVPFLHAPFKILFNYIKL